MYATIFRRVSLGLRSLAFILCAVPSSADPSLCERAARNAASETGVSLALLRAIMLAESGQDTGQGREPWPWTLHSRGQGHWLTSPDDALQMARELMADGETNIDIGCFQINMHWHSKAFPSLEEMLDPERNALYAAEYLQELYQQTGDWRSAAGAYHSRDAARAETYVARLIALHGETGTPPAPDPYGSAATERPIIRAGGPIIAMGSLAGPLIGGLR